MLVGPWRGTREEALADAVRSNQARLDESAGLAWLVPGSIEAADGEPGADRRTFHAVDPQK